MNMRIMSILIFILMVMNIAGCGFGGFSDSGTNEPAPGQDGSSATGTKIVGVASKGVFTSGTVRVYAVNTDGSETLLCTTPITPVTTLTPSSGYKNYSSSISSQKTSSNGSYNGVVMIKASGSYIDEATGIESTIAEAHPLRALIVNPSGDVHVAVTPLTELAARKALSVQTESRKLTVTDVSDANKLVSEIFKVDIIGTQPVMADKSSIGFANAATTQPQKDYTLVLAAISQMAKETGGVNNVLNQLASDIADGTMSAESTTAFQNALMAFFSSPLNQTGVMDVNSTNLVNVGGTTALVRLGTAEKPGTGILITGIKITLQLPPGVTVKADFRNSNIQEKQPLSGVVTASGNGALAGTYVETLYIPATGSLPGLVMMGLINDKGFTAGEIAAIRCDVPVGASFTAGDFKIYKNTTDPKDPRNFSAVDGNGATIPESILTPEILPILP